ncbi:MAG: hypothetical protein Q7U54_11330 [Bacteroidales bacterium]|nr:hypothetical protein [Bacteroidales bacterium]
MSGNAQFRKFDSLKAFVTKAHIIVNDDESWADRQKRDYITKIVNKHKDSPKHMKRFMAVMAVIMSALTFGFGAFIKITPAHEWEILCGIGIVYFVLLVMYTYVLMYFPHQEDSLMLYAAKYQFQDLSEKLICQIALLNPLGNDHLKNDDKMIQTISTLLTFKLDDEAIKKINSLPNTNQGHNPGYGFDLPIPLDDAKSCRADEHAKQLNRLCSKYFNTDNMNVVLYVALIHLEDRLSDNKRADFLVPLAKYPSTTKKDAHVKGTSWLKASAQPYVWRTLTNQTSLTNSRISDDFSDNIKIDSYIGEGKKEYTSILMVPIPGKVGVLSLYSEEVEVFRSCDPSMTNTLGLYAKAVVNDYIQN